MAILQPLKRVKALDFKIEMNIELPEEVRETVGPFDFSIAHTQRPFNAEVFPRH
jgi:hypothetical protein